MQSIVNVYEQVTELLNKIGEAIPQLILRLVLAWEFGEAGYEKFYGTNWFADITFPFPFNLLPASVSWNISTGFELVGAAALVLGLATRFFSTSLLILTIVAIAAVHWPAHWDTLTQLLTGYRIVDEEGDGFGNYKLPVLYIVMLLPLIFSGAGKISLDNLLKKYFKNI